MRTAKQGALDGLCGVYAVINAVDLIIGFERSSTLPKELFSQLTHGLGAVVILNSTIEGIEADDLERATALAFGWLSDLHGEALVMERPLLKWPPKNMASYLSRLRKIIGMPETAAIVGIKNPVFHHWSVVTKIERSTLKFRDSDNLRELDVADYQLNDGPACVRPAETMVIRRQPFRWMQRVGQGELEQIATPLRQDTLAITAAMDELDRLGRSKVLAKRGRSKGRKGFIIRGDKIYDLDAVAALARMNWPKGSG